MTRALLAAVGLAALIAGCSSTPGAGDGPGDRVFENPAAIPDAVPRVEPLSRYGNPDTYEVFGVQYAVMASAEEFTERGIASWYGKKFHGRRTSSGEPYDMYKMTAAHKELPLPTYVEVTHLENGRKITVKVNDRGPFADNRIIDLSYAAAAKLDMLTTGTAPVEIRVVTPEGTEAADTGSAGEAQPTRQTEAAEDIRYFIQVGAFGERHNAERSVRRIEAAGLSAPASLTESKRLHRVRVGPVDDVARVDELTRRLSAIGFTDTHVVVE